MAALIFGEHELLVKHEGDLEAEVDTSAISVSNQGRNVSHRTLRLALLLSLLAALVGYISFRKSSASPRNIRAEFDSKDSLIDAWAFGRPKATCKADIDIESPDGAVRVDGMSYSSGPVLLLKRYQTNSGELCSISYLVACVEGHATLRTENHCKQPVESHDETLYEDLSKEVAAGSQEALSFQPHLLPDRTSGKAKLRATFEKCPSQAGQCKPGCCPSSFRCVLNAKQDAGTCLPIEWTPESVCENPKDAKCQHLVTDVMSTTQYWELMITTGGGGGHLAAAKNLGVQFGKQWSGKLVKLEENLTAGLALLTDFGRNALTQTIAGAKSLPAPTQVVDIMHSPCTNLLGEWGMPMGHMMQAAWDNAQQAGNIAKLNGEIKLQPYTDVVFGRQCLNYMRDVLRNSAPHLPPHHSIPNKVVATEPLMLSAIAEAIEEVMKNGQSLSEFHVYMTDLPGVGKYEALNFFMPIRIMAHWHPERTHRLIIHSLAPISGGAQALAKQAAGPQGHIDASQVVIEEFMPVTAQFLPPYDGRMPRPGQATQIPLKAQTPEEHTFLGGDQKSFSIAEGDELTLVMLGSQPTVSAIQKYFDQAKLLNLPADTNLKRWVFFACGPHQKAAFSKLYASIAEQATAFNNEQETSNGRLRLIPFTGQPAQIMEGRAEVTVTRSGGMTAGELLALSTRGDQKKIFLHIETTSTVPRMPMLPAVDEGQGQTVPEAPSREDTEKRKQWEEIALANGMVTWEAGNARYLMAKLGAKLITPEGFAVEANSE